MNDNMPPPIRGIGGNFPPEPVDLARERVDQEVESADKWAAQVKTVDNEEAAAALADKLNQLEKLFQQYDAQRAAEKKPHDQAAAAVQSKWKPLLEKIDICRRALKPLEAAWLTLKAARLRAAREKAEREAAEAQRRADQLAEQAKASGANVVTNMIAATEAGVEAERARQAAAAVPQRAQSRGNLGGRARSLRTVWRADIHDLDKAFAHYKSRPELKELLSRLGNAEARSGVRSIPGFFIYHEEI